LVTQDSVQDREPRFSMLEPVREFGLERRAAEGQCDALCERHARFFATLAEPTPVRLEGPEPQAWLDHLEAERDNFRAALRWTIDSGNGDLAQRIAGSLWEFWSVRGPIIEGRRWLSLALEADESETVSRAEALRGAGELAWRNGDYDAAMEWLEQGLALHRRLGAEVGIARSLNSLGLLEMARGRLSESMAHLEASLAQAERIGDLRCIARAQHNLGGNAIRQGDYEGARQLLEANVELARRIENQRCLAYALSNLG
jgi:tetratricopeptide (TPR) repeat protein